MFKELFDGVDSGTDPLWIVKYYFNAIVGISFPYAINTILEGTGYGD